MRKEFISVFLAGFLWQSQAASQSGNAVQISLEVKDVTAVLTRLFEGTDVSYQMSGRQIVLARKSLINSGNTPPLWGFGTSTANQNRNRYHYG